MRMRTAAAAFVTVAAVATAGACGHEVDAPRVGAGAASADDGAITPAPFFGGDPATGAVFALDVSFWEGTLAEQEMDCFWDSGVRHIVAGTQVDEITRQQLALAVARGMTIDTYVYLHWDEDIATQVNEALALSADFPVETLWLDVEEPTSLGATTLTTRVQQAVDACRAQDTIACGIYTGPGFWKGALADTHAFADVPLWYAWYNGKRALSSWTTEAFGGWSEPRAKQWAEEVICGVGADKDTMIVEMLPTVTVDRAPVAAPSGPPPAPVRLWPSEGTVTALDEVKLSAAPIPFAVRYEIALETLDAQAQWRPYFTWSQTNAFRTVFPTFTDAHARFRVRAKNAHGWGAWSPFSRFVFGAPTESPPDEAPPDDDPPEEAPADGPPDEPAHPGVPAELTPSGTTETGASVTLTCAPVADAARYRFAIETIDAGGAAHPYFTYEKSAPAATFYPQTAHVTYRFTVQAQTNGTWSAPSAPASFVRP